jgi:hypothetical protein
VPPERLFPISAITGRGVRELVAAVRGVLDELGPAVPEPETDALNLTEAPRRFAAEVCPWILCGVGFAMHVGVCVGNAYNEVLGEGIGRAGVGADGRPIGLHTMIPAASYTACKHCAECCCTMMYRAGAH